MRDTLINHVNPTETSHGRMSGGVALERGEKRSRPCQPCSPFLSSVSRTFYNLSIHFACLADAEPEFPLASSCSNQA